MKAFLKNQKILSSMLAIVVAIALFAGWSATAGTRGKLVARYDVRCNHFYILAYGLAPPERAEYARLLKERYGIELRKVADCIVSESLVSYVNEYDNVSVAAAINKFGHDVFEECWRDAVRNQELRRSARKVEE
jgi:hypothetical protein